MFLRLFVPLLRINRLLFYVLCNVSSLQDRNSCDSSEVATASANVAERSYHFFQSSAS